MGNANVRGVGETIASTGGAGASVVTSSADCEVSIRRGVIICWETYTWSYREYGEQA